MQRRRSRVAKTTPGPYRQTALKHNRPRPKKQSKAVIIPSSYMLSMLLTTDSDRLTKYDEKLLTYLCQDERIESVRNLSHKYLNLFRNRNVEDLADWLESCRLSGLKAFRDFGKGLESDLEAVENAISQPWSNGQTEGQVNRLKLIKRQKGDVPSPMVVLALNYCAEWFCSDLIST